MDRWQTSEDLLSSVPPYPYPYSYRTVTVRSPYVFRASCWFKRQYNVMSTLEWKTTIRKSHCTHTVTVENIENCMRQLITPHPMMMLMVTITIVTDYGNWGWPEIPNQFPRYHMINRLCSACYKCDPAVEYQNLALPYVWAGLSPVSITLCIYSFLFNGPPSTKMSSVPGVFHAKLVVPYSTKDPLVEFCVTQEIIICVGSPRNKVKSSN